MGWTSINFSDFGHKGWNETEMNSFLYGEFNSNGYDIVKSKTIEANSHYDHNVAYLLMRHPKGYYFAMVVLIDVVDGEILWKEIDETMGPNEDKCPIEFILVLPKTDNEQANDWRKRCLKNNNKYITQVV